MTDGIHPARTRFAPSPTGFLHIGSLRTVLFNWLWAHHTGGQFILRIEDTDRKRFVPGAEEQLIESMQLIGLMYDEGPHIGGPYAPYHQSQRLDIYHQHAAELEAKGVVYRSYATAEEIEQINAQRVANKQEKLLSFRNLPGVDDAARAAAGAPYTLRFNLRREGQTVLNDLIRGQIVFDNSNLIPDPVLLKSDGYPTYALAAIVDDHIMQISHVLRADEWLPSSPVHIQLYEAFGWEQPIWVHVPQVLGPDGKKLSKRHGDTSVTEYLKDGFLPEAIVNYLALIGWSYDDKTEIMTTAELIERFDLNRIKPSGGVFDREKLLHFNGVYLRGLAIDELARRVAPYLEQAAIVSSPPSTAEMQRLVEVLPLVQERLKLLSEAPETLDFFFQRPALADPKLLVPKKTDPAQAVVILQRAHAALASLDQWDLATLEERLRALTEELGLKTGQVFMAIRVAISGRTVSPGLFETLVAVGQEETLVRLDNAATALAQSLAVS